MVSCSAARVYVCVFVCVRVCVCTGDNGIQELASQPVTCLDIVTPYGAAPLMLFDAATADTHTLQQSSRVTLIDDDDERVRQRRPRLVRHLATVADAGSVRCHWAASIDGKAIAPLLTWDVKGTSLLTMLGGLAPLTRPALQRDGVSDRFVSVVEREYGLVFPQPLGAPLVPRLPTALLPNFGGFTPM